MHSTNPIIANLHLQRGHLFAWIPICLAIGIGLYFSIRFEPKVFMLWGMGAVAVLALFGARLFDEAWRIVFVGFCLVIIGFSLAGLRSNRVDAPVLGWRYFGEIEGRVIGIDKSASDALRITLDQVKLGKISAPRTPQKVRISLHSKATEHFEVMPGAYVKTKGFLMPPSGPTEPGGFDFQRFAWFAQLGAVGYTRTPINTVKEAQSDWRLWLFKTRMAISKRVKNYLSGDTGGFASAITTGERSGISQETLTNLRISNIAHLLAISGLHMGLLSGFVFMLLRIIMLFTPYFRTVSGGHKWAAFVALLISTFYLGLSGGNVATQRAFIMVMVALCAVMLNRRAISMHSVAIAALIVLVLRPEALLGAGFQMSFAATTALVVVFSWLRDNQVPLGPKWLRPVVMLCISSSVAGLATAPIAAAHFHTVSYYGLIANVLCLPIMGLVIVPAGVLSFVLMPIGGEAVGLWIMGKGIDWILFVAQWVSSLGGARGYVHDPIGITLPMMMLGLLWLLLWKGLPRLLGLGAFTMSLWFWHMSPRPDVLIDQNGSIVGVMTDQGRALSKEKGAGFVARNWLLNDGNGATQRQSASLWRGASRRDKTLQTGGATIRHVIGKKALSRVKGCAKNQLLVSSVPVKEKPRDCDVLDPKILRGHGAIAIYLDGERTRLISARETTGQRIWSSWPRSEQTRLPSLFIDRSE